MPSVVGVNLHSHVLASVTDFTWALRNRATACLAAPLWALDLLYPTKDVMPKVTMTLKIPVTTNSSIKVNPASRAGLRGSEPEVNR